MEILGPILLLGMGFQVYNQASSYGDDYDKLNQSITDTNKVLGEYDNTFNQILNKQAVFNQQVQDQITASVDKIGELENSLEFTKTAAAVRYRAIQFAGVLFISGILFLYILKYFGFLDDIKNSIIYGFKSLFGMKK